MLLNLEPTILELSQLMLIRDLVVDRLFVGRKCALFSFPLRLQQRVFCLGLRRIRSVLTERVEPEPA